MVEGVGSSCCVVSMLSSDWSIRHSCLLWTLDGFSCVNIKLLCLGARSGADVCQEEANTPSQQHVCNSHMTVFEEHQREQLRNMKLYLFTCVLIRYFRCHACPFWEDFKKCYLRYMYLTLYQWGNLISHPLVIVWCWFGYANTAILCLPTPSMIQPYERKAASWLQGEAAGQSRWHGDRSQTLIAPSLGWGGGDAPGHWGEAFRRSLSAGLHA